MATTQKRSARKKSIDSTRFSFQDSQENISQAAAFIKAVHAYGCRFALDDFGRGMSFFAYFRELQVDYLRTDGLFVKELLNNPIDHSLVESMNDLGRALGLPTIAEWVESDAVMAELKAIGVDYAQEFAVGKPHVLCDVNQAQSALQRARRG